MLTDIRLLKQVQTMLAETDTPVIRIAADAEVSMQSIYQLRKGRCPGIRVSTLVKIVRVVTGKEPLICLED